MLVCAPFGEIHFCEASSEVQTRNTRTFAKPPGDRVERGFSLWQKNKPTVLRMNTMTATKRLKEWKWILSLWAPCTVSCSSTDPKTSGSFLERQFTSFCLNSPCNVLKVKTFLLFKQTKPRVCARSRRTRSPKWGSYETGFFNTGWSLLLPQTVRYKPTNIVFMKWKLGVSDSKARLIGQ